MNFKVIENPGFDFDIEEVIKDYQNPDISTREIKKKHRITTGKYKQVLAEIKNRGIPLRSRFPKKCKYYYPRKNGTYEVRRVFQCKLYYFGTYMTEEEAQERVKELHKNGWNGLIV